MSLPSIIAISLFHLVSVAIQTILRGKLISMDHGNYIKWLLRSGCARMNETRSFRRKEIRFVTALELIKKWFKQIK